LRTHLYIAIDPPFVLSQALHIRPLLSLCLMVLSPGKYVAQGSGSTSHKKKQPEAIRSTSRSLAEEIVQKILQHLNVGTGDLSDVLRASPSTVYAGEPVDLGNCLIGFTRKV
jgi:hypothetical protein